MRIALRILEEVARRQPVGVGELARVLGLPKTSVHRSVWTMRDAGWLRPTGDEMTRWMLSGKALSVGLAGPGADVRQVALPEMTRIRDTTGETVHLAVLEGDSLVVVGRLDGTHPLRTFLTLGTRAPLHATANGKAVLASMPDPEVERVLEAGLERFTGRTIVDPPKLRREIAAVRKRGYATTIEEWRPDIGALGAAIVAPPDAPLAALSISMPLTRFRSADQVVLADLVTAAAGRVSQELRGATSPGVGT